MENNYAFPVNMVSAAMKRVYVKMTLALVVTAVVAMLLAGNISYMTWLYANTWFAWVVLIAEIGLVMGISGAINRLSSPMATLLFYVFAVVNGLMLSNVFMVYSLPSLAKTFFITAGVFGAMSIYGFFTTKDLTRIGSFLFMVLIGLIIASVVNIFAHSTGLEWIISIAGVLVFVGLTAWDTQQIKNMAAMMPEMGAGKLATLGALSLYLDFVNLFLYLLRFFGSSRD